MCSIPVRQNREGCTRYVCIFLKTCLLVFRADILLKLRHVPILYETGPLGPGKRGHIVADTLLPKLGNIFYGHEMFLNKIRNIYCLGTKFVSAANVARAGKRGNICVGNNVSSLARALTGKPRHLP